MKLPRDLSGSELIQYLCQAWSYRQVHRVGSHVILETTEPSRHRVTVPDHSVLRVGTLAAIVKAVTHHKAVSRSEFLAGLP
jgi:predicted RNA binding protein YcfA (HicA-like mRNA interferase family)